MHDRAHRLQKKRVFFKIAEKFLSTNPSVDTSCFCVVLTQLMVTAWEDS